MFGPIMQFRAGDTQVKLAPVCKEDMAEFVRDGGMQSHSVMRWMGNPTYQVLENEIEYYDHQRKDSTHVFWGIFVHIEDGWQLIGSTSLMLMEKKPYNGAVSGFLIFRPEWWGKGIASICHRARTMYAFDYLNLVVIRSAVMEPNIGSHRALTKIGYVHVATERNASFEAGDWYHQLNLEVINSSKDGWHSWWHDEDVPKEFRDARKRTREALEWAREHVELL